MGIKSIHTNHKDRAEERFKVMTTWDLISASVGTETAAVMLPDALDKNLLENPLATVDPCGAPLNTPSSSSILTDSLSISSDFSSAISAKGSGFRSSQSQAPGGPMHKSEDVFLLRMLIPRGGVEGISCRGCHLS